MVYYNMEVTNDPETGQSIITRVPLEINEIITHDGIYHADEVVAIATIFSFVGRSIPVRRTRHVTKAELANPTIWVLDQYGQLDTELNNYDHHQDKNLESTNVQILKRLFYLNWIPEDIYKRLLPPYLIISEYDVWGPKGKIKPFNGIQFNEIIKGFNNIPDSFKLAVEFAETWITSHIHFVYAKEKSNELWKSGKVIAPNIRVCADYPLLWQSYNEEKLMIAPEKGIWKLYSADTGKFPIKATGKETFIHTNLFIAGYSSRHDAVEAALGSAPAETLEI